VFSLNGQTALVTGGSRGLGLAMAEALGRAGARIVITARKSDELTSAREQLEAQGIHAVAQVHDVADIETIPAGPILHPRSPPRHQRQGWMCSPATACPRPPQC
jgi:NAD(P)-dependent dehydrogenase (short-subunit alcohol dehydrogenase family)